jgi:hypothetical protein
VSGSLASGIKPPAKLVTRQLPRKQAQPCRPALLLGRTDDRRRTTICLVSDPTSHSITAHCPGWAGLELGQEGPCDVLEGLASLLPALGGGRGAEAPEFALVDGQREDLGLLGALELELVEQQPLRQTLPRPGHLTARVTRQAVSSSGPASMEGGRGLTSASLDLASLSATALTSPSADTDVVVLFTGAAFRITYSSRVSWGHGGSEP